ncbi:histidine-type phosphatase [Prevotella sp. ne3005]|uniref:histidine-type phosphatase n=1 Tax=Prevotella sp. ne3005 TaxID=1761887 RepID=UPI001FCCF2F5|nr:histidine-type phosphatase [Prevotella sp. ne3005]
MRKRIVLMMAIGCAMAVQAQKAPVFETSAKEEIMANRFLAGSNYLDYDRQLPTKALTPTPKGYEPYYMSHYGRHGSRWLISDGNYSRPIATLETAKEMGKLTAKGEEVLETLKAIYKTSTKRLGDLTTVGERQHHGIGKRMTQNFPEIFKKKDVMIDARSTVVTRCILSMIAECEELAAANPTARIHNDVSESLQYYLNQPWEGIVKEMGRNTGDKEDRDYSIKWTHPERLMKVLFNDQEFVYNNISAGALMRQLFHVACNMQSHDTDLELFSLFTDEEIYDQWRQKNIGWYLDYGPSPVSGGKMPFSQLNLLKNIIETADTVTKTQATLRFGHEVCVMPLACLLELDNCGMAVDNLDELDKYWRNYRIFPMGCNIQLIFYRPLPIKPKGKGKGLPKPGPVLVKALLNEREAYLPIETNQWPYYNWQDLREYYLKKIEDFSKH